MQVSTAIFGAGEVNGESNIGAVVVQGSATPRTWLGQRVNVGSGKGDFLTVYYFGISLQNSVWFRS